MKEKSEKYNNVFFFNLLIKYCNFLRHCQYKAILSTKLENNSWCLKTDWVSKIKQNAETLSDKDHYGDGLYNKEAVVNWLNRPVFSSANLVTCQRHFLPAQALERREQQKPWWLLASTTDKKCIKNVLTRKKNDEIKLKSTVHQPCDLPPWYFSRLPSSLLRGY